VHRSVNLVYTVKAPTVPAREDSTTTNKAERATDIERVLLFSYLLVIQGSSATLILQEGIKGSAR
jgi:hypothetical protein